MFGTVVGKPVEVELVESIKRGAERCRFIIRMS
jgi:predicted hydrocarbon binding protein